MHAIAFIAVCAQLAGGAAPAWSDVLDALHAGHDGEARAALEAVGRDAAVDAATRAHAWSWAGQIAARRGLLDGARSDFVAAQAVAPASFDGRMAAVHEGEVELRARRWDAAEQALSRVEHDPDPIIGTYAAARLRAVRQRPWRRALRATSVGVVALAALALAVRVGAAIRRRRWRRQLGPFGRALLVAEVVALAGALIVPRWVNPLASSGWMASAIPSSIGLALLWATRPPSPSRRRAAVAVTLAAVACAAGLYLALDLTWWSVADPMP